MQITSTQNPRVKEAVKLRERSYRDQAGLLLIEGYREIKRALDNRHNPIVLFFCRSFFLGKNEDALLTQCREVGAQLFECNEKIFQKVAYRDRPEGLLAIAAKVHWTLSDIAIEKCPLLLVAEAIEKPGNLGTLLRTADAAGVNGVIVCDQQTDINNPNVVRASIGTVFTIPTVEAPSKETIPWLQSHGIQIIAAMPASSLLYTDVDMRRPSAIVVGSEQYGLGECWRKEANACVSIPMHGQCDSLNVAAAASILLYEAVRQRCPAGTTSPAIAEKSRQPL